MAVERKSRPSLKACLLGFVVVTGVLSTATLVLLGERRLREFEMSVLAQIAERRGNAAAEVFARALWTDWRDVSTLAAQTSPNEIASAGPMLDLIVGDGERISWAGIAALDGTVVAASKHMLEGASVAERPWFIAGLDGPFAGDVHEAKLLPAVSGETLRFLDLSAPIQTTDGRAVGVVGFHLNHAWAVDYLAETARFVGVDAVIVNRSGEVVVGPKDLVGERFSIASIGAAGVGTGATRVETWPDGTPSMTVVIPALTHRDLPSFGWSPRRSRRSEHPGSRAPGVQPGDHRADRSPGSDLAGSHGLLHPSLCPANVATGRGRKPHRCGRKPPPDRVTPDIGSRGLVRGHCPAADPSGSATCRVGGLTPTPTPTSNALQTSPDEASAQVIQQGGEAGAGRTRCAALRIEPAEQFHVPGFRGTMANGHGAG
jgi:hypothetical protein